eukprot:gene22582-biopygen4249
MFGTVAIVFWSGCVVCIRRVAFPCTRVEGARCFTRCGQEGVRQIRSPKAVARRENIFFTEAVSAVLVGDVVLCKSLLCAAAWLAPTTRGDHRTMHCHSKAPALPYLRVEFNFNERWQGMWKDAGVPATHISTGQGHDNGITGIREAVVVEAGSTFRRPGTTFRRWVAGPVAGQSGTGRQARTTFFGSPRCHRHRQGSQSAPHASSRGRGRGAREQQHSTLKSCDGVAVTYKTTSRLSAAPCNCTPSVDPATMTMVVTCGPLTHHPWPHRRARLRTATPFRKYAAREDRRSHLALTAVTAQGVRRGKLGEELAPQANNKNNQIIWEHAPPQAPPGKIKTLQRRRCGRSENVQPHTHPPAQSTHLCLIQSWLVRFSQPTNSAPALLYLRHPYRYSKESKKIHWGPAPPDRDFFRR